LILIYETEINEKRRVLYMKAKSYVISLILIICLILSAVIGYKKGYLGDVFNFKTKRYVDNTIGNSGSITRTRESIYENESSILDIGDEYVVEYEAKDYRGNIDYVNSYKIKEKYLDSYITRTLPDGMEVTYYDSDEKNYVSDNGKSLSEKYSYLIVTLEITNNEKSNMTDICPTNIKIGYFDEDGTFKMYDYTRGSMSDDERAKGHVNLPIGSNSIITMCYVVPDELLDKQLVIAGEITEYDKGAPKVPYFKVKI
jgi:hypothetical protein